MLGALAQNRSVLCRANRVSVSPTLGTRTGYRAAEDEANGPEARLAVPDGIDPEAGSAYQPRWAVRALTSCNCREDT